MSTFFPWFVAAAGCWIGLVGLYLAVHAADRRHRLVYLACVVFLCYVVGCVVWSLARTA
jgi:hypothetical protein